MKLATRCLTALALCTGLAGASAQTVDAGAWMRALVDSPHHRSGDDDALLASWLDLIESAPDHPLAEATLRLIELTRPQDPRRVAERLSKLDPQRFEPLAAGVLSELQSRWRVGATVDELVARAQQGRLFAGFLRTCKLLGPLGGDCHGALRAQLFAEPGFDREHAGPRDLSLRWLDVARSPDAPTFDLESEISPEIGWGLSAFLFDVPIAGPGWIEIDCSDASGPLWLLALPAQDRDWHDTLRDPSFVFAVNGGPEVEVDFLAGERSLVQREPVLLRAGRNRLLLASNLGARLRFAVRVLDERGRPWSGLSEASDDRPLGDDISARAAPSEPLPSAEHFLAQLASVTSLIRRDGATGEAADRPTGLGVDVLALLGLLEMLDGRPSRGLTRIQYAAQSAPERIGLQALLAQAYQRAPHLPDTWKRGRARALAEEVVAVAPDHGPMQLALARVLIPEDREEEAIAMLADVARREPSWAEPELDLAAAYARLDLDVPAENALLAAHQRAPDAAAVIERVADHLEGHGQASQAFELRAHALELDLTADSLRTFAQAAARLGHTNVAEAGFRASTALGASWQELLAQADFLSNLERFDAADALLATVASRLPYEPWFPLRRADVARLRDDTRTEREHLLEVLRRSPSHPVARARLRGMGEPDAAREFERRYALDVARTLASFDAGRWNDSVVRVIDASTVYVFEDGGFEQLNHVRDLVRDLQGCESEGKQAPDGEVLSIATIKAKDGRHYEPVAVDGEYVMPSLEPGDTIEILARSHFGPPHDGVVRTGEWFFESVEKPFHLSRYVISMPKALGLRMVLRNFTGEHREIDEGARVVHVFEVRERDRVLLEPASPPSNWILPWVAFGHDREREVVARRIAEASTLATRVTPEIAAAAAQATAGLSSEDDKARVLHAFVSQALDKRAPNGRASALAALLSREGNGAFLYAALLEAAGIDHDLVWSRNITPAADPEPDPPFVEAPRWMRKLFVLVEPDDAPQAWCDLSSRTLPYGVLIGDAPGASAFAARAREWTAMPDCALDERVGERHEVRVVLDGARGAEVEVTVGFSGNIGHALKERFRELPAAQRKRVVSQFASAVLTGIDVAEYDLPGLDSESEPAAFFAKGKVKSFLDEAGGELACKLPFPALGLSNLVSGEGQRKHPFFLGQSTARRSRARFELPEGWKLAQPFSDLREERFGGSYRLVLVPDGERAFTLERELLLPPLVLDPASYPELVAFAQRIDEAERTRLRFIKAP